MTLGQIWYYMIYLSDNEFLSLWGKINYLANNGGVLYLYFAIALFVIPVSMFTILRSTKIGKSWSFIIGIILTMFVFQVVLSKSGNVRILATEKAEQLYKEDATKFDNWEKFIK